jgi:hypothetical protein
MAHRVAPPKVFPAVGRAPKPPPDSPGADAYRQSTFNLGGTIDIVLQGLALEAGVATASSGAKFRTMPMAAALGLWSRGWLARLEVLHAAETGNYTAAIPLVRAAADYLSGEIWLLRTSATEWEEWLASGGVGLAPEQHATEFRLHPFRSAEVIAGHDILRSVYRAATDLSLPHFGATLLLAGSESDSARVAMTFGDRDFHLGLAELVLGWLLQLGVAQLEAAAEAGPVFNIESRPSLDAWCRKAGLEAGDPRRCHVEIVEIGGLQRYLIHNVRRSPGAAPKRILL